MPENFYELRTLCPMGQCEVTIQGKPSHEEFQILDCSRWHTGHRCQNQCAHQVSLEHALELGRRVQEMLQPELVQRYPGLTVSSWMSVSQRVSGDFQAIHRTRERLLAIQGDVMGKGVNAALLAAYLVGLFDALAHSRTPLTEMLAILNRRVARRTRKRPMFATCSLVEARINSRTWSFCRAGHEQPVLLRADGSDWQVDCGQSLPLGVEAAESYRVYKSELRASDQILLMTDGGLEVGLSWERSRELMRDGSTPKVVTRIASELPGHPPYRDDVSLLWLGVDSSL
ncbi:serine/threonine-protein phosphatase [bacterium]|nr:serine/threonine-protein phosphatase [bacterium]